MLQILLVCTITSPLDEVSAYHDPVSELIPYRVEVELDHWHFERDGRMIEYASLDLSSPIITGARVPEDYLRELVIIGSAIPIVAGENRDWWTASPAGKRVASAQYARYRESRAAARFKQRERTRPDPLRFAGKRRMRC
jgi:hypothetical protein